MGNTKLEALFLLVLGLSIVAWATSEDNSKDQPSQEHSIHLTRGGQPS